MYPFDIESFQVRWMANPWTAELRDDNVPPISSCVKRNHFEREPSTFSKTCPTARSKVTDAFNLLCFFWQPLGLPPRRLKSIPRDDLGVCGISALWQSFYGSLAKVRVRDQKRSNVYDGDGTGDETSLFVSRKSCMDVHQDKLGIVNQVVLLSVRIRLFAFVWNQKNPPPVAVAQQVTRRLSKAALLPQTPPNPTGCQNHGNNQQ